MAKGSFGLIVANRAVVLGAIKARDLLDQAEQAEASGVFDSVWVGDSLLAKPRLESITLLSALAGVTRRMRLAVGCMATFVHRHPVLLAQQWASLDVLSEGRALLAVCLGGPDSANAAQAAEHAVMGIASGERVERLEEGITILRKLFAEPSASHAGRFYRFDQVGLLPRPVQQPCPIWIASNPTALTWKGGASASERGRRAWPAPRGALRRRLDDQQAVARRIPSPVRDHPGHGARGRPRPGRTRQRALSQHQRERGPPGRAGPVQSLPGRLLHGEVLAGVRGAVDRGRRPQGVRRAAARLLRGGPRPHGPAPGLVGPGRSARALSRRSRSRADDSKGDASDEGGARPGPAARARCWLCSCPVAGAGDPAVLHAGPGHRLVRVRRDHGRAPAQGAAGRLQHRRQAVLRGRRQSAAGGQERDAAGIVVHGHQPLGDGRQGRLRREARQPARPGGRARHVLPRHHRQQEARRHLARRHQGAQAAAEALHAAGRLAGRAGGQAAAARVRHDVRGHQELGRLHHAPGLQDHRGRLQGRARRPPHRGRHAQAPVDHRDGDLQRDQVPPAGGRAGEGAGGARLRLGHHAARDVQGAEPARRWRWAFRPCSSPMPRCPSRSPTRSPRP